MSPPVEMAAGLTLCIVSMFTLTAGYPLMLLADEWLSARLTERRMARAARMPVHEHLKIRLLGLAQQRQGAAA